MLDSRDNRNIWKSTVAPTVVNLCLSRFFLNIFHNKALHASPDSGSERSRGGKMKQDLDCACGVRFALLRKMWQALGLPAFGWANTFVVKWVFQRIVQVLPSQRHPLKITHERLSWNASGMRDGSLLIRMLYSYRHSPREFDFQRIPYMSNRRTRANREIKEYIRGMLRYCK